MRPECTVEQALEAASLHPARALGIQSRKGTLDADADADLVVLDSDLAVVATFVAGVPAWTRRDVPC